MEYKPCGQLNVDLVGSRIVIRDAAVRHGVILLEPRHIVSISKHTDEQEQQQEKEEEEKVHVEQVCDDIDLQVEGVVVDHAVVGNQQTLTHGTPKRKLSLSIKRKFSSQSSQ
jgi:hypothetical protein